MELKYNQQEKTLELKDGMFFHKRVMVFILFLNMISAGIWIYDGFKKMDLI